jgi:hypothetical protein
VTEHKIDTVYVHTYPDLELYKIDPWRTEIPNCTSTGNEGNFPLLGEYSRFWVDCENPDDSYYGTPDCFNPIMRLRYNFFYDKIMDEYRLIVAVEEIDERNGYVRSTKETLIDIIPYHCDDFPLSQESEWESGCISYVYVWGPDVYELFTITCWDGVTLEIIYPDGKVEKLISEKYLRE